VAEKGAIAQSLRQHVWPWLERKAVVPVVFRVFAMRDAAEAHRVMESGVHIGKLVLQVASATP
jgi:NADPH:quinone reductase-like Zn-dependent oxidoreductase